MNALNRYVDPVYCLMRFIVGLLLACHGGQLVLGLFGGMSESHRLIIQVGGWIQVVGGLLIALGLLTRLSAFICSGMFAVAYFMMHVGPATTSLAKCIPIATAGAQYSNHGELAVLYCWIFFFMVFYGPGRWSIDALLRKTPVAATGNAS